MNAEIESTLANQFREEAQQHRREQLAAVRQADRERHARQAAYCENAARLLDDCMREAGL